MKTKAEYLRASRARHRLRYRVQNREYEQGRRENLRLKLLQKMGGKCVKCGHADWRALQFDHIAGDGAQDRARRGTWSSTRYKQALEGRFSLDHLQVLCANCNWVKRYEHQEGYKKPKDQAPKSPP